MARAHKLWDAGERTADIGRAVGVSRDTIVGYARRHAWGPHPKPPWGGIHRHRKPPEPQQKPKRDLLPAAKPQKRVVVTKSRDIWASCRPAPLAVPTAAFRGCQWIETQRPLRMCDAPVSAPGSSWCASHRMVVYHRPPRWAYAPEASP